MPASVRSTWRRLMAVAAGLVVVVAGCRDGMSPDDSSIPPGSGRLSVFAAFESQSATNLVIEVTAPDIPQMLVFNLPIVNQAASGSVTIPAGGGRQLTVRAFDGRTETHRGTRTVTIVEGTNPALSLQLLPLAGTVPVTVSFGVAVVTVTPAVWNLVVDDTLGLQASVTDAAGAVQSNPVVRWASTDTRKLTIDSTGRAIARDTGVVRVVAVANAAAGTATITIGPRAGPTPPGFLRTWVGGFGSGATRNNWAEPNNWSPASVPTATDSVVIGAAAFQPAIPAASDTFRVRDLVLRPGALLQLNFRTLTVQGGVLSGEGGDVVANGEIRLIGNSRLRGVISTSVTASGGGTVSLADSARVSLLTVEGTSTVFDLAARKLVLTGSTSLIVRLGAVMQMDAAADTIDAAGTVSYQGDAASHVGAMTAGTLIVRGSIANGTRIAATGTHTTILASPTLAAGVSSFDASARPDNVLRNVRVTGVGGVNVCSSALRVTGSFTVEVAAPVTTCTSWTMRIDGPLATVAGSNMAPYGLVLGDGSGTFGVNGAFSPTFVDFTAVTPSIKAGLAYQNIEVFQTTILSDSVRATGTLTIDGINASVELASLRPVRVGALTIVGSGVLTMTDPSDTLVVSGGMNVNGSADLETRLTAGAILLGGNLDGQRYGSSGTHRLVLNGTGAGVQSLNSFDNGTRPANLIQNLEVANAGGLSICSSSLRVRAVFRVSTAVPVTTCTSWFLRVDGDIQTVAGSTMQPYGVTLANPTGTSNVLGVWSPQFTDFTIPNAPVRPGLAYQNLRFFASNTLLGNTTLSGELYAQNAGTVVTLGGRTVTVGGAMRTATNAQFAIANGDTITVNGYFDISAPGTVATGGQLTARGDLNLTGFSTTGSTFKLVFAGSANQLIYTGNQARTIPRIENRNVTAVVQSGDCCITLIASDSLVMPLAGATIGGTNSSTWVARNVFATFAGSTITGTSVNLDGTATLAQVNGTFAPTTVRVVGLGTGPGTVLRAAANITPANVLFQTSYALSANLEVPGAVTVEGANTVLTFNGRKVVAPGGFDLNTGATAVMANAADSLVAGNGGGGTALNWDGGVAGVASAGTIFIRGGNSTMTNFAPSGTNTVIVTDTGFAAGARQFNFNSNTTFNRLRIEGSAALTVFLQAQTNTVLDSLVMTGGNFTSFNSGYGVALTGSAGLRMSGGSLSSMYVNLPAPSGTANVTAVSGYNPLMTRFFGAAAQINPAITYQNVEIYAPTSLLGNTNVSGGVLVSGAALTLAGRKLTVGGTFDLGTNGNVVMSQAADTLDSSNHFYDGGVAVTPSAGVMIVRGANFNANNLQPTAGGTHKVLFTGTGAPATNINANATFRNLEVAGTRGIFFQGTTNVVTDTMRVSGAASVASFNSGYGVSVRGPLIAAAGSSFNDLYVQVQHPTGTAGVDAASTFSPLVLWMGPVAPAFSPDTISLRAGLPYRGINILSQTTLSGNTTMTGDLNLGVSGATSPILSLGGRTLTVGGNVTVDNGGRLFMLGAPDTLRVTGSVAFNGGAGASSTLSGGVISLGGNLSVQSANAVASGSHTYVMTRNDATTQFINVIAGAISTAINNLEIAGNGSRTVTWQTNAITNGNFSVTSPAAAITVNQSSNFNLTVRGVMSTTANTTINFPGSLQLDNAAGLSNVLGPTTMGALAFAGVAQNQIVPADARYSFNLLSLNAGATATVGGPLRRVGAGTSGQLFITGTLTIPDGVTLLVCGNASNVVSGGASGVIRNIQQGNGVLQVRFNGNLAGLTSWVPGAGGFQFITPQFNVTTGC
jgi:hypothetical protein